MTLSPTPITLTGPVRSPAQMLADQTYGGGKSVHDEEIAGNLGLAGAPIEGPTHFSQIEPLCAALWGDEWFTHGCISSHFLNMVFEGETVQASVSVDGPGARSGAVNAVKGDGTPVLTGTVSVGTGETALAPRLAKAQANPPSELHILDQLSVGQRGAADSIVSTAPDTHYGQMYPFTLNDKLAAITEHVVWFDPAQGASSPWGDAIMPMEMFSVLTNCNARDAGFVARQPSIGLFIDLEVQALGQPVLVNREYKVVREIVALAESRRTESMWTRSLIIDPTSDTPVASVLLHQGVFKASYPHYPTGE